MSGPGRSCRSVITPQIPWVLGAVVGAVVLVGLPSARVKVPPERSWEVARETIDLPSGPAGQNLRAAAEKLDGVVIVSGRPLAVVADVIVPMQPSDGYRFAPADGVVVAYFGGGAERLLGTMEACCKKVGLRADWRKLPPRSRHLLPFVRDLVIRCPAGEIVSFSTTIEADRIEVSINRLPVSCAKIPKAVRHRHPPASPRQITAYVGDVLPDGLALSGGVDGGKEVRKLFCSADVTLANLEAPITDRTAPTRLKTPAAISRGQEFLFRSAPQPTAALLGRFGVDAVSLANNHTLDYRPAGLEDTLDTLAAADIEGAGAGRIPRARRPRSVGGVTLVSYVESITLPGAEDFAATGERPGVAVVNLKPSGPDAETARMVRADIARARQTEGVVVVGVHWGEEGSSEPAPRQVAFAHFCIQAGADVVWGHHPHVLQPVEIYQGGIIAYSLGNFIFPSPRHEPLLSSAVLITCHQDETLAAASLVGVVLDGKTSRYGFPELALTAARHKRIRKRLLGSSSGIVRAR